MSGQSFRFLQAGSFQLQASLQGLTEAPDHLGELLVEAPFDSAAEVFQVALRNEVDFVVLTGDILDPTAAGPRATSFLQQQFQRLAEQQIRVYWAASRTDLTANWLRSLEWPDNVRIFPSDGIDAIRHHQGDEPVAVVVGRSWDPQQPLRAAEFVREHDELFTVAVLHANPELENYRTAVSYWALGGGGGESTPFRDSSCAHSAGTPQGRSSVHCGPRGCSLVHVSGDGEIQVRPVPSDAVRWCHERIAVNNGVSRSEIRSTLKTRIKNLIAEAKRTVLVRWTITGEDRFDTVLADEPSRVELLEWLRDQFGHGTPAAWSASLELEPAEALPQQWIQEDSILGDFLRVVERYQDQPDKGLDLEPFILDRNVPNELATAMNLKDGTSRNEVLRAAAILGADLLRGDESEQ